MLLDVLRISPSVSGALSPVFSGRVASGIGGVDLWAAPGAPRKFESIDICGVKWTLVDPAAA